MEVAWKDSIYIGKIMEIFRLGWGSRIPSRGPVEGYIFFLGGLLGAFFSLFFALGRFLGAIVVRSRVWERFLAIWSRFLEVLEGFGEGFGRVLRVFFDDFSQYHRK